jgi:hypothetical protein
MSFSGAPKNNNYVKYKIHTILTVSVASPFLEDIPFDSKDIKHFQKEQSRRKQIRQLAIHDRGKSWLIIKV